MKIDLADIFYLFVESPPSILKFVKCLQMQIFLFLKIYCSFLQMEGVGGHTTGLNILKLQPIQLLEAVVSS